MTSVRLAVRSLMVIIEMFKNRLSRQKRSYPIKNQKLQDINTLTTNDFGFLDESHSIYENLAFVLFLFKIDFTNPRIDP